MERQESCEEVCREKQLRESWPRKRKVGRFGEFYFTARFRTISLTSRGDRFDATKPTSNRTVSEIARKTIDFCAISSRRN